MNISEKHIHKLVNVFSINLELKKDDTLYIEFIDVELNYITLICEKFIQKGIKLVINTKHIKILEIQNTRFTREDYILLATNEINILKHVDAFLGIRNNKNSNKKPLNKTQRDLLLKYYINPVHNDFRNNNLKWLYFRWPNSNLFGNSQQNLVNYINASTLNYMTFKNLMQPLKELIENTEIVSIKTKETDIVFSIKNIASYFCIGKHNIPDGEVHTSPIINSVNGVIKFNTPSTYQGIYFENIELKIKNGEIIFAKAKTLNQTNKLNEIINHDIGSKFFGEFSFGLNPYILESVNDILIDEKMHGSIHFAIGNAYPFSDNGNRSSIHWDLILNLNKDYGGGTVSFDDQIILKDGTFILSELKKLNKKEILKELQINSIHIN